MGGGGGGETKGFPKTMGIARSCTAKLFTWLSATSTSEVGGQGFGDHKLLGLLLGVLPAALQSRQEQAETARTAKKTLLLGEIS